MITPRFGSDGVARMMEYDNNKKSVGVGYLLWVFLGWVGAHRFYMGAYITGILMVILNLLGFITLGVTWAISGLWLFIDLFLIPGMARRHNEALIARLT